MPPTSTMPGPGRPSDNCLRRCTPAEVLSEAQFLLQDRGGDPLIRVGLAESLVPGLPAGAPALNLDGPDFGAVADDKIDFAIAVPQ